MGIVFVLVPQTAVTASNLSHCSPALIRRPLASLLVSGPAGSTPPTLPPPTPSNPLQMKKRRKRYDYLLTGESESGDGVVFFDCISGGPDLTLLITWGRSASPRNWKSNKLSFSFAAGKGKKPLNRCEEACEKVARCHQHHQCKKTKHAMKKKKKKKAKATRLGRPRPGCHPPCK